MLNARICEICEEGLNRGRFLGICRKGTASFTSRRLRKIIPTFDLPNDLSGTSTSEDKVVMCRCAIATLGKGKRDSVTPIIGDSPTS